MKQKKDLEVLEVDRLTNEELKNNILETNKNQLSKVTNMSYHFFIKNSILINKKVKDENFLYGIDKTKEKSVIYENWNYIMELFKTLNDRESKIDVGYEMNKLLETRKTYQDLLDVVYGYEIELSYIKELFNHYIIKIGKKKEYNHINSREVHILQDKIKKNLLDKEKDYLGYVDIVSNVLELLPFRISKSKYFDILYKAMIRNLKQYPQAVVENQIEEYKKLFNSPLHDNYGIIFDSYFTDIQRFKNMPIEKLRLEELENSSKDMMDLSMEIENTRKFITDIGILINRLIVILLNKDKLFSVYEDESVSIFKVWEDQQEESLNPLMKRSKKTFIQIEKELLKDIDNLKILNDESLKRKDFIDDDLNQERLFTSQVLTYYNDMEFIKHKILFPDMEKQITGDYLEQLTENLIYYIERNIIKMTSIERKIRMRRLLSVLELPFTSIEQFSSYIEYALDYRIVSSGELLFSIDRLNHFLDGLEQEKTI